MFSPRVLLPSGSPPPPRRCSIGSRLRVLLEERHGGLGPPLAQARLGVVTCRTCGPCRRSRDGADAPEVALGGVVGAGERRLEHGGRDEEARDAVVVVGVTCVDGGGHHGPLVPVDGVRELGEHEERLAAVRLHAVVEVGGREDPVAVEEGGPPLGRPDLELDRLGLGHRLGARPRPSSPPWRDSARRRRGAAAS
jgi:hypothetical protein